MDSEEIYLIIKVFHKEKTPLYIKSKDIITLKEIKEKAIKHFRINKFTEKLVKFIVKDNNSNNDDKIYISSEDDIIKNSIEKDPQNVIIELLLTTDDIRPKTELMNKYKDKNKERIIDYNINNIKNGNKKNKFKIINNKPLYIEGNTMEINQLNQEIKNYKQSYSILEEEIQNLKKDLENYKEIIERLKNENLKLAKKLQNSNKNLEIVCNIKDKYINELKEKIKEYKELKKNIDNKNKAKKVLIKEEKLIDFSIQSRLEKPSFNEPQLNLNYEAIPISMGEESSTIFQNYSDSNNKIKNDLNPGNSIENRNENNFGDILNNLNIEELISGGNKKLKFLSRNEEIKIKNDISYLNPKTEIKKVKSKKKYNIEEKKLDITTINKIRKQCGDQVKDYSDEKIQKILDDNGGNYIETITDIMLRLSRILSK